MTEKSQRERFEQVARELECDEDEAKFNANLRKIATPPKDSDKGSGETDG